MKRALITALLLVVATAAPLLAGEYELGALRIEQPWARATSAKTPNGAAYLTLAIEGAKRDRLVSAATPVARRAALHTHLMQNNVMKMRPVDAIDVTPGSPTVLKPGGLHIMLMGLKAPLEEGSRFPLTLTFDKAGSIEIQVEVHKAGAMSPGPAHGHGS